MLRDDLRYSLRMLRKSPLFTSAVVLTVALAIGATTAVFAVVNAVLVRPLPFADPARLVWVAEKNDKLNLPTFVTSTLNFQSWREQERAIEPLGAIGSTTFNFVGEGEPEQFTGGTLTASVFSVLGIAPVAGRPFNADEEKLGAEHVAMISESLWQRRFAADPALIGRTLNLNGVAHTIVGIVPAALNIISPGDVWTPLTIDPATDRRLSHTITAIGRLRPGVSQAQAQAEMEAVATHVGQEFPEVRDWGIQLVAFPQWIIPDQIRTILMVLLAAVACVLLIAAANIANLLLARALAREQEVAVRTAIGASRARVLRQLLIESLMLSTAGGVLGALAAVLVVRWSEHALPPNVLPVSDLSVDGTVLLVALGLSLVTGILFGLAPALQVANTRASAVLRAGGRAATGGGRSWLRRGLAIGELALATALLVVTGLLLQTAQKLQSVDLGFDSRHLLTFEVMLPLAKGKDDGSVHAFYRELVPALAAVPGVTSAAVSSGIPFGVGNFTATPIKPAGASALAPDTALTVDWRLTSPDYFQVMKIPLLRGRVFRDSDDTNAAPVIVVSDLLAQKFWGTDDVLGNVVHRVGDNKEFTVIGVVGDVRHTALNQIGPAVYYSTATRLWPLMDIVVRTSGEPESVLADVRSKIHGLDPALPISNVRAMTDWIAASGAQPRLNAGLLTAFSALALLIAALGIYSVIAHSVGQRTGEIGLRMALGAQRTQVVGLFLREGMGASLAGIAIGLAAALAAGPITQSLVFGISAYDAATVFAVAVSLALVALVACAIPARRAAGVDPAVALRGE